MTALFHQLGHRFQWSLDSLTDEGTGDGAIIGPRYMDRSCVTRLPDAIRTVSLFDPQFFLPQSAQGKLSTYPFFPQVIAGGFATTEWDETLGDRCAQECLRFQDECAFGSLVIPGRFYDGMPSDFVERQETQFVRPFMEAAERLGLRRPILLQLIVTDQMLRDERYQADLLNWVTSFPELAGVYLIYHVHNRRKQIDDIDFLIGVLQFCRSLKQADLRVVVGYTNTEAILLSCVEVDVVSMGAYENLRMFSTTAFEERDESPRRGPNARVYIPRLLQWVEYPYLGAIRRVVPDIDAYIHDNEHRVEMFSPIYNWHFTKPHPYKHFFGAFADQFRRICSTTGALRIDAVVQECERAIQEYDQLSRSGLVFDPESAGTHIPRWLTALNLWRRTL